MEFWTGNWTLNDLNIMRMGEVELASELMVVMLDGVQRRRVKIMVNDIKKRAQIYFKDGKPFKTALDISKKDLEKMRLLGNEIAHQSAHSKKMFNDMVREVYGSGRAYNAGGFLLSPPPSSFNLPGCTKVFSSIFEYFADILLAANSHIAPDCL